MAAPKRSDAQREHDLELISALYLRGKRQVDIAAELGVTQQQISYDLKTIQKRWQQKTVVNINEIKQRELARLDELERTYWDAWERSLGERMKTRTERNTTGGGDGQRDKASVEKETLLGDPRYLAGIERCVELRCKILGINAPQRVEHSGKVDSAITLQEWRNQQQANRQQATQALDDFTDDQAE